MSTAPSTHRMWHKPTLVSPQSYTSLTLTKTDIKRGSGKLTAGYVRSLKCLSDYEKNHTLSLCGGVHVTAFRRSRQGFSSLSPIITQQMTARHTEHWYTTVRRKMNTLPLHLTHSASDLMNDVTDPRQPADRSGYRKKTVSLHLQLSRRKNLLLARQTTAKALCRSNCNSLVASFNYYLSTVWNYIDILTKTLRSRGNK